jgi:SAM-dependent methyltransferase
MVNGNASPSTLVSKKTNSDESWSFGRFSRRCSWLQKFTILQLVKSFATYQPVVLNGRELKSGDRECADRWQIVEKIISSGNIHNVLDLGCAEGFFIREAASQKKCIALGVDADIRRVTVAQSIASYEGIIGAAFLLANITPEFVRRLPEFDVVLFFSVLHHVMYERGLDEAQKLMNAIRSRTRKKMVFDMGQSNETEFSWAKVLPSMDPDPTTWITQFLRDCGFSSVEVVGESEGYHRTHRRILFVATP